MFTESGSCRRRSCIDGVIAAIAVILALTIGIILGALLALFIFPFLATFVLFAIVMAVVLLALLALRACGAFDSPNAVSPISTENHPQQFVAAGVITTSNGNDRCSNVGGVNQSNCRCRQ